MPPHTLGNLPLSGVSLGDFEATARLLAEEPPSFCQCFLLRHQVGTCHLFSVTPGSLEGHLAESSTQKWCCRGRICGMNEPGRPQGISCCAQTPHPPRHKVARATDESICPLLPLRLHAQNHRMHKTTDRSPHTVPHQSPLISTGASPAATLDAF